MTRKHVSKVVVMVMAFFLVVMVGVTGSEAMDKVSLRTNWLWYGSHSIFFLGVDKGFYEENGIDVDVKQGNGSGNAVRLVANKDSTFAYASASTMMNLAAQGAPVVAVATIDAMGTDACLCRPDSGIKVIKDLEGKQVMTTAGAGVNTFFPVALQNAGVDMNKIKLINVAEGALVSSYLQNLAPCILGGIDDKPAEIEANGGEPPVIFNYADYGVAQPGYAIVAHQDMIKENPDLVRRFVKATLMAVKAAKENPDESIQALINWSSNVEDQKEQARKVLDVTLSILISPNNKEGRLGYNVPADWESALKLLKEYKELETDKPADAFYTNEFLPESLP
ncbi:MAG: ABC transporter substrate-binding protein [Bacteroidales bacterium]|nr:ABC transporter substrate-binding protein [Bacteroidales bacterium]